MISSKFECEADLDDSISTIFDESSESSVSGCEIYYEIVNNGATETTRKLNKLRSIKLVKLPSVRLRPRKPNYMKTTTCSTAKEGNFQKPATTLTRRSSFKPPRSLTRLPSTKFRRPLIQKKMNKSKSIKLRNRDAENAQFKASPHDHPPSKSSLSNKSLRVITRSSSMRPTRMLKKMSSLRSNRSSMKKAFQMLDRPTCSSTLKDSKFPNHLELQSGGSESQGISTIKVCPYTYCSLHGHSHSNLPPLKRFVSMRRRVLRTQPGRKLETQSQSSLRAKRSSNVKKGIQGRKLPSYNDSAVGATASTSKVLSSMRKMGDLNSEDTCARDGEGTSCMESVSEDVLGQLSEFPTAESHAVKGQKEGGSVETNSPKYVLNATETDDITSSHEEISETGQFHHEVNEHNRSTSNLAVCECDMELITWEENASEGVVSRTVDNTISSVPICEQLEEASAACEEKNGDDFPQTDSESDYNTRVVDKSEMEKQKYMGLWHLIYKHMASGIAAEDEVQAPATETDKDQGEDAADTCPGTHKSGSSDFSGLNVDDNHEKGSHIQLYQRNAIKLVKEAFDKILSEIPDQSLDDQSSDSDSTQNKEFAEKNHDGEELSIPSSFNGVEEPEKTMLNTDITDRVEAEKTQSEMGSKSKQETPRNWSYLKKIIIRNRFVKALDKAKKFNPRKPRFLPILSDPEAEKIHLRHQSWEEKKKSEEWMLDYALQQVISTLAPSQKRKVALLVQAFESVGPLPNNGTSPSSNVDASSHPTQDESCIGLSYQKSSGKGEETNFGISLHKTSLPNKRSDEYLHHINDSFTEEEEDPDSFSMLDELNLESSCTSAALNPQITAAPLKEFGVINLDNNDHNSLVKDDQPDSINGYLVQDAPKLADVANPLNDVLADGEAFESEVHDLDLRFNNQHDVADTSNYVLADGQVSASEVHDLESGFNDQHDIANTANDVLGNREVAALGFSDQHDIANTANDVHKNREVSASEVHELDLGFNDQHDVANTSPHDVLANGEISESKVHDQHDVLANGEVSSSEVHAQDLDLRFNYQHDVANTSNDVLSDGEVSASEVHDLDLGFNDQHDVANNSNDVLVNGEISASEVLDLDLGFNKQQFPSNYQINERSEQSDDPQNQILQTLEDSSANGDVNSLVSVLELVGKTSKVTKGETVLRNKLLQLITPHEESKASSTELTHEKQKNMGLWHLIYKHMVSGTTTLVEEAEQGSHVIVAHGMNNTDAVHHFAGNETVDCQQIEAIRMVEEAIDEIPLFDSQDDSPDDHPITSDIIPDQEHIKQQPGRVSVSTEAIHSTAPDPKDLCLNSEDTTREGGEKNEFGVANKTKQKTQKSWSNLKKMILLRRFVKALEKVKEFNPREPRLLALDSEKEAEKVLLRHQDMENRKNADEWMLDYALQQVVAKLTPARKRKVQLLVEAFETVVPSIET